MNNKFIQYEKVVGIIAVICIFISVVLIAFTPTARGFELSPYDAYDLHVWLFLSLSVICGYIILAYQLFKNKSNYLFLGSFILIFVNIIFLLIPLFRGYAFFPQGDSLTHWGIVNDIVNFGFLGSNDYYPSVHIWSYEILNIVNINQMYSTVLIYISNYLLFVFGMFILANSISNSKRSLILIIAFSIPLFFSYLQVTILPFVCGIMFFPILFYLFNGLRKKTIETSLLLIIISIGITFIHPVITLYVVILFTSLVILNKLTPKLDNNSTIFKRGFEIPLLIFIIFFTWYFSFVGIQRNVRLVISSLSGNLNTPSILDYQFNILEISHITILQQIQLIFYKYGLVFIYLALMVSLFTFLLIKYRKQLKSPVMISFIVLGIVAFFISLFSMNYYVIIFEPLRVVAILIIIAAVLNGLLLNELIQIFDRRLIFKRYKFKNLLIGITIFLVTLSSLIGVFNLYGSPRVIEPNLEVTDMEFSGMDWFTNVNVKNITTYSLGTDLNRYEDYKYGVEGKLEKTERGLKDPNRTYNYMRNVPTNFGYDSNSSIIETFKFNTSYLMISKSGIVNNLILPENVRFKGHYYSNESIGKLYSDRNANKLYDNGEFNVWFIFP